MKTTIRLLIGSAVFAACALAQPAACTAASPCVSVTVAGQTLTFSLPLEVKSFKCTDSNGVTKTGFTAHGDVALCNISFGGPVPQGFSVSYKAVYSADVPPAQQPLIFGPASMLTNTGQIMVPAGSADFTFTLTYP